ncbi:hypothetical protein OsJ_27721 [Oryza sativa Japonica Group]|uniref:Uncharacterized protein n=1 Tax=Oryza sativa subsp. japonica TaxID=39947 RepID=B9G1H2_ORYSJ|nr:hypothetical protein OsJ_27721 [Oryza sativa Japonica Group]
MTRYMGILFAMHGDRMHIQMIELDDDEMSHRDIRRFAGTVPNATTTGDIDSMVMYAGQGVGLITEIIPASEVVKSWSIWHVFFCPETIDALVGPFTNLITREGLLQFLDHAHLIAHPFGLLSIDNASELHKGVTGPQDDSMLLLHLERRCSPAATIFSRYGVARDPEYTSSAPICLLVFDSPPSCLSGLQNHAWTGRRTDPFLLYHTAPSAIPPAIILPYGLISSSRNGRLVKAPDPMTQVAINGWPGW